MKILAISVLYGLIQAAIVEGSFFGSGDEVDVNDCCPCTPTNYCLDYTPCTPYCGYGKCNIFGCNCDGGCRRPKQALEATGDWKEAFRSETSPRAKLRLQNTQKVENCRAAFNEYDLNGDGVVSFLEWAERQGSRFDSFEYLSQHWLIYDVEGKGYLTKEEAYHRKP